MIINLHQLQSADFQKQVKMLMRHAQKRDKIGSVNASEFYLEGVFNLAWTLGFTATSRATIESESEKCCAHCGAEFDYVLGWQDLKPGLMCRKCALANHIGTRETCEQCKPANNATKSKSVLTSFGDTNCFDGFSG